jgi:hypothetical protein
LDQGAARRFDHIVDGWVALSPPALRLSFGRRIEIGSVRNIQSDGKTLILRDNDASNGDELDFRFNYRGSIWILFRQLVQDKIHIGHMHDTISFLSIELTR